LIKGANDQRSTPMANQMVPLNHGPRPTKINIAVASMVQQRAILLFNSVFKTLSHALFFRYCFCKAAWGLWIAAPWRLSKKVIRRFVLSSLREDISNVIS
jgi:hypothetical protein